MNNSFMEIVSVSRETRDALRVFSDDLILWNKKINLISKTTESTLYERHILDSLQLWQYRTKNKGTWLDLGTGGGFPGLVLAIYSKYSGEDWSFTFVEADARKAAFLQFIVAKFNLTSKIYISRIEDLEPQYADIITSRALADLGQLLNYCERHKKSDTSLIFLKGKRLAEEVKVAKDKWNMKYSVHPSLTDSLGHIIKIEEFIRVD